MADTSVDSVAKESTSNVIQDKPVVTRQAPRPPKPNGVTGLLKGRIPTGSTPIPPSLQAKMQAMANRASQPAAGSSASDNMNDSLAKLSINAAGRASSFPIALPGISSRGPKMGGLAARRAKPNFSLADIDGDGPIASGGAEGAGLGINRPSLGPDVPKRPPVNTASAFSNFNKIVDPSGRLNFNGKAILHASGVDFSSGASFAINMDQLVLDEELGKGNYGVVRKVLHKTTNVAMAMKEIRLELDSSKLNGILMELDILHRAVAPNIVEFYGAFFIESCVYYCMEFMDPGSLDKLYHIGTPEDVLGRIASSITTGLKFLKDNLQIMHRDIKPTNILINRKGEVKLCDFGVSGQLEKSLAKTNIGCQSYMAPERIKGESQNNLGTYSVSSDVWSLGLTLIEIAVGHYPYPPETYSNVFAQLTAIVHGDAPELPGTYSADARDWVANCLIKEAKGRATYAELLQHPFMIQDSEHEVDMAGWVERAVEYRQKNLAEIEAAANAAPVAAHAVSDSVLPIS